MSPKYLFHASIGPVQEFIAEARRIKDLWVGSYLLSLLIYEAITPFLNKKHNGVSIIYPSLQSSPLFKKRNGTPVGDEELRLSTLPNHFLTIVPEDLIDKLAEESRDKMLKYWKGTLGDKVKQNILTPSSLRDHQTSLWDHQTGNLWEYLWVAIPIEDNELETNYRNKAQEIQKALEERKLTRTFTQWNGEPVMKCTQCGKREQIGQGAAFWEGMRKRFKGRIKDGDRLCAVCLIKRLLKEVNDLGLKKPFPFESTADIACLPFKKKLNKLENEKKKSLVTNAQSLLEALGREKPQTIDEIDGTLFFQNELRPERLVKEYLPELKDKESERIKKEEQISPIIKSYEEELRKIKKSHNIEPCGYYTLFAMDGDEMGKWVSDVTNMKEQMEKSKLLAELSIEMPKIIKSDWDGTCIYSGGDDILAFGPLEGSLSVSWKLREAFGNRLNNKKSSSAGMVITHYHNPLRKALGLARENVEQAKEKYGRDSLVITVQLPSGQTFTGGYKWSFSLNPNGSQVNLASVIAAITQWIKNFGLSPAFTYDILNEIPAFYEHGGTTYFEKDMFNQEAMRLLKKHTFRNSFKALKGVDTVLDAFSFIADPKHINREATFDPEENFINLA